MRQKQIGSEVFGESVDTYLVPDVGSYIETGRQGPPRKESWRGVYRLHYHSLNLGVRWELLASLNGRLLQMEELEDGTRVGVFGARARDGHPFLFRLKEKDWTNTRAITKAITLAGGPGTFVVPGCALAVMRAILELSRQGEPMPHDTKELETLFANWPEEIDPFDDDPDDPWAPSTAT